ncbi:MAG: isoprenyl transferase [Clostridiales Family XIII bacterium]|nr:isoprenyl transferase [Clostridiales Family XIII bacterium]
MDKNNLPRHTAIIMDGNGRWAEKNNLSRIKGHEEGMWVMKKIVRHSANIGIKHLTVYAFSTENWKRTKKEVGGLMKILIFFVDNEFKEIHENNVKIRLLGEISAFDKKVLSRLHKTVELTKNNTGLNFNIALNYGSRDEMIRAVKKIYDTDIKSEEITEKLFAANLWTKEIPDPDLIIRTSGEKRLSNFLLWQAAYSEFVFTDTLWPDFNESEYEKCILEYQKRKRRFGGR